MWWVPRQDSLLHDLPGLVLCLLTAYIVMETNARQHIIRTRTRMMSCLWLILAASLSFMHAAEDPAIAAAFLCAAYYLLFRCYQRHRPQLDVFHAFLMLGVGSFFAPVMLPMAIPFFLYLAFFLRSLTRKAFWAGILGIIIPYWCLAVWCFIKGDSLIPHLPFAHFRLTSFHVDGLMSGLSLSEKASACVIALLAAVSIIHYLRTKYDDKIRARMILYIYMWQTLLLMAFLVLQPASCRTTMALLVASASPLIAHCLSLTRSWLGTFFFFLSLLLVAGMAALNFWPAACASAPGI